MHSLTLLSLATATAATQIPFFIPGFSSNSEIINPDASIVSADATTTIMALSCPSNSPDDSDCPWGELDMTVGVISKTVFSVDVPAAQVTFDCTSKKDMTCTAAIAQEFTDAGMDGFTAGSDGTATGTTVYPSSVVELQTARVVDGLEKLSAGAGPESEAPAKTTSASASAKETGESSAAVSSTLKTTGGPKETGATPSETGVSSTEAPSGTSTAPAEASGAASRFGVEGAAWVVLAGAAALQVL
ncbi:hypothetical protein GRF29_8g262083 [Pseudopithomyces chartarum]|uniref:Uncharacterized protein n=1 Tax=Pseudopithomyces chartarum TaxID=1892770 RepID=A0AAN6M490_9PLEO|nr:hypothetical protein GRF29_8g262083 [Pseudopithomyces chartarum]